MDIILQVDSNLHVHWEKEKKMWYLCVFLSLLTLENVRLAVGGW